MALSAVLKNHSGPIAAPTEGCEESPIPLEQQADRKTPLRVWATVAVLLLSHAGLLAYSATRHSPTMLEPASLAAGIMQWQFARCELYRVNPPLVKMVAAFPVLLAGCETDWSRFYEAPGARPEFVVGADFVAVNGQRSLWLFTLARWACIPFSLIGALVCFLWARDLYGVAPGLLVLTLWCFEPNIIAHGQLLTTDMAATACSILAGYTFWRWLAVPTWNRAAVAGFALGAAQLAKMTSLLLLGLWPALWLAWRVFSRPGSAHRQPTGASARPPVSQLVAILVLAIYSINLGYGFDRSLTRLGTFTFVSEQLAGPQAGSAGGNRFIGTWLSGIPVPLPSQYLLGLDIQQCDFETFSQPSYLRGQWSNHGWWHYYLYSSAVKLTHGTQLLIALALGLFVLRCGRTANWRDELVLVAPSGVLFLFASAQTEFSHHFRYVLPSLAGGLVLAGRAFAHFATRRSEGIGRHCVLLLVVASVGSSLCVYPHSISYFNELAGGPANGHNHLLHSNIDWGQDLLFLKERLQAGRCGEQICLVYYGPFDPSYVLFGPTLPAEHFRPGAAASDTADSRCYVVSINYLKGDHHPLSSREEHGRPLPVSLVSFVSGLTPVTTLGYSLWLYKPTPDATVALAPLCPCCIKETAR